MTDQKIKLAILIPVFNNLNFTRRCLERIDYGLKQIVSARLVAQIVVSDDGSTDGTSEWISNNRPEIIVLKGDGSLWWSGGINLGVEYAIKSYKADYILWWNNDIEPREDYFINLFKRIETNTPKNIIGSKIYMKGNQKIWGYGGYFNQRNGKKGMFGNWEDDKPEYLTEKTVDWLPGMGSVFPVSVFNKVGLLDQKRFPQYHGDSDYTLRAKKCGYTITVYPDLVLFNDTSNSGLRHDNTFQVLKKSLTSIKSNYNIKKEWMFYRQHSESLFTYRGFFSKFGRYIGGFFKWKLLMILGRKRTKRQT